MISPFEPIKVAKGKHQMLVKIRKTWISHAVAGGNVKVADSNIVTINGTGSLL